MNCKQPRSDATSRPDSPYQALSNPAQETTHPVVAIIGRPNVGKSALFNRLAKRRIAIVHDQPGVTRDRIEAVCTVGARKVLVLDTGGIAGTLSDDFAKSIEREADIAIGIASVILFVVDAKDGVTPSDSFVADKLRKALCPVILVVNKVDVQAHEHRASEFATLGFEHTVTVSAAHGRGMPHLVGILSALLPEPPPLLHQLEPDENGFDKIAERTALPLRIAIVGKPNAGKSSLTNALLNEQRTIVSHIAGTTRDAVDIPCRIGGREAILIDTAGLRHRRKHRTSVEVFSAMRAEESIHRADLCLLVVDLTERVTVQDKKIGQLIQEAARPVIVAAGKFDLVKPSLAPGQHKELCRALSADLFFLEYAPVVLLSAKTGENIPRLVREIWSVAAAARRRVSTGKLNRLLQEIQTSNPPPLKGNRRLKILYGTALNHSSTGTLPVPVFVLFVNDPSLMSDTYRRFLEGRIREIEPYPGVPLQFRLRGRSSDSRP